MHLGFRAALLLGLLTAAMTPSTAATHWECPQTILVEAPARVTVWLDGHCAGVTVDRFSNGPCLTVVTGGEARDPVTGRITVVLVSYNFFCDLSVGVIVR